MLIFVSVVKNKQKSQTDFVNLSVIFLFIYMIFMVYIIYIVVFI